MQTFDSMNMMAKCTKRRVTADARYTKFVNPFQLCFVQALATKAETVDNDCVTLRCHLCAENFDECSVACHFHGTRHASRLERLLQGQHGNRQMFQNLWSPEITTRMMQDTTWFKGFCCEDLQDGIEMVNSKHFEN